MKNKLVISLVISALLAAFAVAQVASESLMRIQSEVQSGAVTAFFEKSIVIDGVTYRQPWQSVSWNASDKQVSVGGKTMTYGEVMQFVLAIANQERSEQLASEAAAKASANP